ncbi:MAG TPA: tripartite tricarboxylate transporter substrate-binding protein [Burkholderiales bacterium]|nr:tripartite tricarboxylate transporter substrate-binding protein [Burkholderiales bacterium]
MRFPRVLAAFLCAICIAPAGAQDWPSKPLRIIATGVPGGPSDLAARLIGERLSRALGRPVRVENRQGDGGVQAAAGAAADGYTFLLAPSTALVVYPYITDLLPYSPEDDFAGVAMIGSTPFVLVANPSLNVKTLADLIALAREAPGRLAYASPGLRTPPGILGEMLRQRAALELMQVPYLSAQSVLDVVAGRTHIAVESVPAIATAVQRGQLRALAVSSARRLPELKDVPTFAEAFPEVDFSAWYALVAPAGTPDAVLQRMNIETSRLLAEPEVEPRLNLLGIYPEDAGAPAQIDAFFKRERAYWRKTARELKMEPE